jgi:hypothetical protein
MKLALKEADQILKITNPPLTVWLPCDKCDNGMLIVPHCGFDPEGNYHEEPTHVPCTCTDGKVEREIEWSYDDTCEFFPDSPCEGEPGHCMETPCTCITRKTLHLHDLYNNPDVIWAYRALLITPSIGTCDIPNNKGTLRIREVEGG